MLRTLLADRFKLALHHETRELPGYALVIARSDRKLGPQLRSSDTADCLAAAKAKPPAGSNAPLPCGGGFSRSGHLAGRAAAFPAFVLGLSNSADRIVFDRSGLSGGFDWDLQWTPDPFPGVEQPNAADSGTSLFTALQEQLGLKLESTRGPVEVLVIDHVGRPSEN